MSLVVLSPSPLAATWAVAVFPVITFHGHNTLASVDDSVLRSQCGQIVEQSSDPRGRGGGVGAGSDTTYNTAQISRQLETSAQICQNLHCGRGTLSR